MGVQAGRVATLWTLQLCGTWAAVLMLDGSLTARGQDWKSPTQFVGLSGQVGNYEAVQRGLDHLEWQDVRQTNEKATHSLKELYDGQMAWRTELENIEVSFQYSLHRQIDTAHVIAQKRQKHAVPDNFSFEARVAMKGEKRYTHIRETTPGRLATTTAGDPARKRRTIPLPEFVYAFNGTQMKAFEPARSLGHIHPAKLDSVDSRLMWYFDSISIPTGAHAARQRESAWYVPVALGLPSVYRVIPTLQEVDGFPCHVVTNGADTIWIDTENGFAMRRRVWFQMRNLTSMPVLADVYVNKDFHQYGDSIWLPHQCYRLDFAGSLEPANTQGMLTDVHTVTAKTINVNNVPDDVFELDFPSGTNVQDLTLNKSYFVPHGEHLLDEAIARANPIINGEVQPFHAGGGGRGILRPLLLLNAGALFVLGTGLLWRRRRTPAHS
jgi:hypothetical protein